MKITSTKLTIVRLRNIETVSDIFDNEFIWDLTFKIGSRGLITPETFRNIKKKSLLLMPNHLKSFRKELSKVVLLTSCTIWSAWDELVRGSENQLLLSA